MLTAFAVLIRCFLEEDLIDAGISQLRSPRLHEQPLAPAFAIVVLRSRARCVVALVLHSDDARPLPLRRGRRSYCPCTRSVHHSMDIASCKSQCSLFNLRNGDRWVVIDQSDPASFRSPTGFYPSDQVRKVTLTANIWLENRKRR